ncbi:MAG TPA: PilZ domain-containing protein [Bryobacteraceae bacterium]|nr:PilZ domain-containing protein [Bryobacteraceae bacterium]
MPDNSGSGTENADRRSAVRFPIEQEVRYKVFNRNTIEVGSGKTINMSSNGVLFTTERALNTGERLEVAVNWPAQLDNKCPLKLVTTGRVVRSEGDRAAIAIERYEFRTQGIHGMS